MRRIAFAICVAMAFSLPVHAGFDAGLDAFNKQDYATAYNEWKPLADQGDREAQYRVGDLYLNGQGVLFDAAAALAWYEKAAAQGQPRAQAKLGMLYTEGRLVPADSAKAFKWYVQAAANGDVEAQINLAVAYADGKGTAQDTKQALRWMEQAAKSGNAIAQYNLGLWYMQGKIVGLDPERGRYWYVQAAAQGDDKAQYNLALALHAGVGGPVDLAGATSWLRKAADHDYVEAQCALGTMYSMGEGVPRDYAQAIYWYQKAADRGYAKAQANLGLMYREGNGVPQDEAMAARYYQLAANQGMPEVQTALGTMYSDGRGVKQDYAKALKWFRKAADQGDLGAFVELGIAYENGAGVPRDEAQAEAWYRKAADLGYRNGRDRLAALQERQQSIAASEDRPVDIKSRLFALVRDGDLPGLERALSSDGANVNLSLDDGMTLLETAIESHRFELARYLVEHGADVNGANSLDATPVQFASYEGMPELIPLLAQRGADLNHRLKSAQQTALFIATERGDVKSVQALLQYGADPNLPNVQNVLPLSFAITGGHKEIARLLLEHGTRTDQAGERGGELLSLAAAQPGWSDIVEIIIAHGAKCGVVRNNTTELDGAADIEIVHLLQHCIEKSTGHTPALDAALANAARNGRARFVEELIAAGAAVDGPSSGGGRVPLVMAMEAPNALEVAQVLIKKGADPNRMGSDGNAALHRLGWQFKSGMGPLVDYLVKHGADVNLHARLLRPRFDATMQPVGDTPLHFAVAGGHREYVQALLANGAQLEAPGEGEMTPLATAISHGRTDIATLLLERGADIDAKGHDTFSPLSLAVKKGQSRLVRFVLEHGADANYRVADGNLTSKTYPLRDAAEAGHLGIVELLLAHGADPGLGAHGRLDSPLRTAVFYGQFDVVRAFFEKKPALTREFDLVELAAQTRDEELRAYLLAKAGKTGKAGTMKDAPESRPRNTRGRPDDPVSRALDEPGLTHFKMLLAMAQQERTLRFWSTDGGRASLLLAAAFQGRADIARFLLNQGVPPDGTLGEAPLPDDMQATGLQRQFVLIRDVYGPSATPLLLAVKGGNEDIVSALFAHGANPNRSFQHGLDTSALAASANVPANASMAEILLKHGALPATVGAFPFDQLVEREEQEEIRLLFDFGLDRNDVGHHDGVAMQSGELNRVNADAVDMIARSRPEQWRDACDKMPLKALSEYCLPTELRNADAALQDGFTRALEKASGENLALLERRQSEWAKTLQKTCHVPARANVPDGWYAAILDKRDTAICVIGLMRRQGN